MHVVGAWMNDLSTSMGKDVAENIWFYPEDQEVVVFGVDFHYFKFLNALGRVRRGFS